tara:strand:- start:266 stop:409 length:144 start_codon:yes stop_codon:yes gene_type:complete
MRSIGKNCLKKGGYEEGLREKRTRVAHNALPWWRKDEFRSEVPLKGA